MHDSASLPEMQFGTRTICCGHDLSHQQKMLKKDTKDGEGQQVLTSNLGSSAGQLAGR